jgi:hypothetical protein
MNFSVLVEAVDGQFAASLVGAPGVRVVKDDRVEAISGLKAEIQHRVALGELLSLEIDTVGISSLVGKYADDPTLSQICDEAYQLRDAERTE